MYPSKGSSGYGQQAAYPGQQSYSQMSGTGFSQGQSAMTGVSQEADLSAYRAHTSMMAASQETDLSAYRAHLSQGAQYCATYAAVYGSSVLSTAHQVGEVGGKGAVPSGGQGRMSYPAALPDSSKFSSGVIGSNLGMSNAEYISASSGGYALKGDQFSAVKGSDYSSADRRHYGDQAAYLGRDLPSDSSRHYADSISLSQQHQTEDMDQASLLRQQQMLKAQALQSGSDMRQAGYLAARAAQEFSSYGGRMDVDPRSLSILRSTHGGQNAASILGGAPRRNADDLYAQGSSTAAYGVGLPPGRDYITGKGLHGPSLQSDYQGNALSRGHLSLGLSISDERKDDRSSYRRELELRDDERRKDLLRDREKEREKEDHERQRDKDRERDRLLERREKERERDRERERKRGRERTPPRATRDRRGSSLLKDDRTPRRASPRRVTPRRPSPRGEAVHRRHSPVKEKKREYICKVHPFCLVDAEKDYLSLSKRYPRLSISPECSKVVSHWPKGSLHLSLNTPVSFEHDVVEVDDDKGEKRSVPLGDLSALNHGTTVWNAKVLLMSGINLDALNDMCSYKSSDEKILHFNNILRFAILKKDNSFMAVGGPWNSTIDGGDPSTEESSLIQTAHRYVRDMTQLDLQNCQKWNRFLEIHYDRVGKDGLFSHKEITVLFVPDLSECIPSLDSWRSQWLAHKKNVAKRERQLATKQEKKSTEKKEYVKEKVKAEEGKDTQACKSEGHGSDTNKVEETKDATKVSKKDVVEQKGKGPVQDEKPIEGAGTVKEETKIDGKKAVDGAQIPSSVDVQKPVKKKVVKKVMKRKVAGQKATEVTTEDATAKHDDQMVFKEDGDRQMKQENLVKEEDASADPVSTKRFTRKKIVKKASTAPKVEFSVDTPAIQTEKESVTGMENLDEKIVEKKEPDEAASSQVTVVKATRKKKIIRRVIKRKVSGTEVKDVNAVKKEATEESDNVALQKRSKGEEIKEKKDGELVVISKEKITEELKTMAAEKDSADGKKAKAEKESENDDKSDDQNLKPGKGGSKEPESAKSKDSRKDSQDEKELTKDEKDNKSKDDKHESKPKSRKEVSDKGNSEEPPQHPGLFLQTKRSKKSKVRSMSISLDGLLHYNDKDIEESIFELSVFAESFNEMLQYQMGCRLLSFLEKLRKRFIISKKQNKRQRDDKSEKESEKDGLAKRPKVIGDSAVENKSQKSGRKDTSIENQEEAMGEGGPLAGPNESKPGNKAVDGNDDTDVDVDEDEDIEEEEEDPEEIIEEDPEEIIEEDPEEIIEDDQEMDDVTPTNHGVHEQDGNAAKSADLKAEPEKATVQEDNGKKSTDEKSKDNATLLNDRSDREKEDDKLDTKSDSGKEVVVHKEVLQAFRYFDHNRVGYIKVEDLRCLLRNLGKFLSYRDVKELVQSALFESNPGRDKRIFYKKLVRLTDM